MAKKVNYNLLTAFVAIVTIIVSLILPNKYESKAILSPEDVSSMSSALQSYSGLAGLAEHKSSIRFE